MLRHYYRKYNLFLYPRSANHFSFYFFYLFTFLISDTRLPLSARLQLANFFFSVTRGSNVSSNNRSRLRSFCLVTGFPRGISSAQLLFSRHEYNRRVTSGRIPGFKKA